MNNFCNVEGKNCSKFKLRCFSPGITLWPRLKSRHGVVIFLSNNGNARCNNLQFNYKSYYGRCIRKSIALEYSSQIFNRSSQALAEQYVQFWLLWSLTEPTILRAQPKKGNFIHTSYNFSVSVSCLYFLVYIFPFFLGLND